MHEILNVLAEESNMGGGGGGDTGDQIWKKLYYCLRCGLGDKAMSFTNGINRYVVLDFSKLFKTFQDFSRLFKTFQDTVKLTFFFSSFLLFSVYCGDRWNKH